MAISVSRISLVFNLELARVINLHRTEQSSNIFEQQLGTIVFASTTAYYPNYPNNCLHLRLIQPSFRVDTHNTSNEWK